MKPKTHDENRSAVCILCLKKQHLQPLSAKVINLIEKHLINDVKTLSWYYPTQICRACSFAIHAYSDQNKPDNIILYKYKFNLKVVTRGADTCSCEICVAARVTISPKTKGKRGRPSTSENAKRMCKLNLCPHCFVDMAKGKRHICTKTEAQRNLLGIIQNAQGTGDPVVSEYMRNKSLKENGLVQLSNLRGFPSNWKSAPTGAQIQKKPHLSADDLFLIKKTCDLSTRRTIQLSSCLRGLDIEIAPNVSSKLTILNQSLQNYFEVTQLPFDLSDNHEMVMKSVVYCNDVPGLVNHVISKRGIEVANSFCKVGVDGGGGSFKITLSIIEGSRDTNSKSNTKDTGVKMLLLLAVAPGVPEKYGNVAKIWSTLLHLNDFKCFIAGDLKIVNLLCGIMGHSSTFPCPYCTAPKNNLLNTVAQPRTLGHIREMSINWRSMGSTNKLAKNYYNCIDEPLLCGSPDEQTVNLCPPPALHITLGVMNAIYRKVESIDPDKAEEWVRVSSCQRHSKYGFTGRNCHKLLNNRRVLQPGGALDLLRTVSNAFIVVITSF